jgi:DNA polymerase III delta subunit
MKKVTLVLPSELIDWLEKKAKAENKEIQDLIRNYLLSGLAQDTQFLSKSVDKLPCLPKDRLP